MLFSNEDLFFIGGPTLTFVAFVLYKLYSRTKKEDMSWYMYPFVYFAIFIIWPLMLFTIILLFVKEALRVSEDKEK